MLRRALKLNKFIKTQKQNVMINGFKTQVLSSLSILNKTKKQGKFEENSADHVCHQVEPLEGKPNVLQNT